MPKQEQKVPVSVRALTQRLNRCLATDGRKLRASRGERCRQELGEFYVLNADNCVVDKSVDLEEMGRELGVLKPFEALVSE